ncbi:beta-ketoacyl-ACP synthase III [Thermocrinis minervae]|uniref:Beta-ketoacyl-[acyl-carrier-protein] synthase III n=1 Tax=Thermocrinis minervae TaxID=381751 RepID=A0A1M6QM31_9AQUI|nr:beta-ketoacyl-ACP synthase III [Thermocrinis minervae]SHK21225.1 3-oxoacyl-[acyl-carrier-protein] synthase-3 [Thermocrinis minervae]
MGIRISGLGVYLPEKVLTNFDLEKMVDTSDDWITTRTGIKERRIAQDETLTYMAKQASLMALQMANTDPEEIDLILVATLTPDKTFPATACLLQAELSAKRAFAFDLSAACSGFLYALDVAHSYLVSGKVNKALVVGAEKLSTIVNWQDRNTCVLFGDGAGAAVVEKSQDGLYTSKLYSDGSLWELLFAEKCGHIQMKGRELFKVAVRSMEEACRQVLKEANISVEDVDLVVPHQANIRIVQALAEKLGIPFEKIYSNIHRYGNTSAASIPIALYEAYKEGKLKRGDTLLMTAMGGGLTWGAVLMRF